MNENTVTITDADFDAVVLQSEIPVLVDFWAVWCGPCKAVAPVVDAIANDNVGKVKVGKLDVDAYGDLAEKYKVMGIPTLLLFKGGQEADRIIGSNSKAVVQAMIDRHL